MEADEQQAVGTWQVWALVTIFATIVVVLVWNICLMIPRSGTSIVFSYNAKDCGFPKPEQVSSNLAASTNGGAWVVRDRRVGNAGTLEALHAGDAAADRSTDVKRVVSSMMDCGRSYCQGTSEPKDITVSPELLARKRQGEDLILPGCEGELPNLRLESIGTGRLGVRPFDALLCLALASNLMALLYCVRGLRHPRPPVS
jgi:hypothetical protein